MDIVLVFEILRLIVLTAYFVCVCSTCIDAKLVCEGEKCIQKNCTSEEFECDDKKCIPLQWYCDGSSDCQGGEDEKNCSK